MGEQNLNPLSPQDQTIAAASIPPPTGAGIGTGPDTHAVPLATAVATLSHIGGYTIIGELGRGGMGIVYRAEDPNLKREVALKVMLPQFAANATAKARFVREARAQAKVEHEHVAAIHQVAEHDGLPYIVMPLLKGMTLHAALKANPRPPISEVIRIAREMAEGLAAAHEMGLVHRDIKPANIWLEGRKLRVRILDFGLARIAIDDDATERDDGPVTREGALIGTPAYMSPEQARGKPVDGRTDLWSLGVILYQMTAGELPFNGQTTITVLTSLSLDTPHAPIERNPSIPPALSALIMRLLSKDPAYRPPTADILSDELRAIESAVSGLVRVVSLEAAPAFVLPVTGADPFAEIDATEPSGIARLSTADDSNANPRDSRLWLYIAGGAALFALVVVVGVIASKSGRKPPPEVTPEEQPKPLIPAPKTKPKDAPVLQSDYREVHGVNFAELKAWMTRFAPGFRPVSISVRGGTAEVLYDAIALPETREWHFVTTATSDVQPVFDDYSRRGFMPKVRLIHPADRGFALSEVWAREGPNQWTSWNGPRGFIEEKLKEAHTTDLVPTQLAALSANDRQFYGTVVFSRVTGQKWEAELDLQLNDLARRVADCRVKGWRPKSLAAVSDPTRARFSAVFAENQPFVNWDFQIGLSTADYEKALIDRKEKRQRPALVASYVADGKPHYAVGWEEVSDPEADRRAAVAFKPHIFALTLRVGWNNIVVKREDVLPEGSFELLGLNFFETKLPPDFTSRALLPAVSELRSLTSITNLSAPMSATDLARLAATAVGSTLTELTAWECELSADGLEALKKFRQLSTLGCSARHADDDILARLKELPKVTSLALRGLDTRGKAGDRGFEAITALPLRSLSLLASDLASQHYRGIADMPVLQVLDLNGSTTDDACVSDLATCPKLQMLTLTATKVTDKSLESVGKMASLKILDIRRTAMTAKGILRLAAARPELRIYWEGGVIEPTKRP